MVNIAVRHGNISRRSARSGCHRSCYLQDATMSFGVGRSASNQWSTGTRGGGAAQARAREGLPRFRKLSGRLVIVATVNQLNERWRDLCTLQENSIIIVGENTRCALATEVGPIGWTGIGMT